MSAAAEDLDLIAEPVSRLFSPLRPFSSFQTSVGISIDKIAIQA
jgi:hypothetical protein